MNDNELKMEATAMIVSSMVAGKDFTQDEVRDMIKSTYSLLGELSEQDNEKSRLVTHRVPAVPIEESVFDDRIVCLEDGREFKSLKRHLTSIGMTPDEYRERWGLPATYPMVCKEYSKRRSLMAKEFGLGKIKE